MSLNEKITLANQQIEKIINYLKENENAFKYMDLKLYGADYYSYSNMEKDFPLLVKYNNDYFSEFCETEYDFFVEDLLENHNINFNEMRFQLGRTSSFFLHDRTIIEFYNNYYDIDFSTTIENIILNCYSNYNYCTITDNKIDTELLQDTLKDYREEVEGELNYIINYLYNDTINYCKDIILVYNMIKNFKDNQVEYFKEFLANECDMIQYEIEEDERIRHRNIETCWAIKNKYNITLKDMETLKNCINDFI